MKNDMNWPHSTMGRDGVWPTFAQTDSTWFATTTCNPWDTGEPTYKYIQTFEYRNSTAYVKTTWHTRNMDRLIRMVFPFRGNGPPERGTYRVDVFSNIEVCDILYKPHWHPQHWETRVSLVQSFCANPFCQTIKNVRPLVLFEPCHCRCCTF